jgi:Mrp family chromosome partitioning ATPase
VEILALDPSDTEEVPEQPAPAPARGKWLEEVRTTVWEGSEPPAPEAAKRQTAPYLSHPRTPAASSRAGSPMDVATPRPVTVGARVDPAAARPASAAVRIVAPVPEDELDGRPTRGYRTVERELAPARPTGTPLMLEAPVQINERVVEQISPDPRLWLLTQPGSRMAEQYRVLALKLREVSYLRVAALVPPTGGKELGLAASNVALAFAEGSRTRVLLVDANLRAPVLHGLFGLQAGWTGLAEQVRQHRRNPREVWNILGVTATLGLMPAGPELERNPSAVLSADPIGELFAEARRSYDFIVISPPPVLESADVNILQDHIDGAVLVVHAGVTRRDSVAASLSRLSARKFIGSVLIDATAR